MITRLCLKRGQTLWRQVVFSGVFRLAGEGQAPFQTEPKSFGLSCEDSVAGPNYATTETPQLFVSSGWTLEPCKYDLAIATR
jgi:hypothetical protein